MHFDAKKFFLIGFILLLLVGIPASVYLVQQQQEIRSRAASNTRLSFQPESSGSNPITRSIGEDIALDIMLDPDTNLVNFVRIEVLYDSDKLATASANAFSPNLDVFTNVIGPTYSPNKIVFILSAENNPNKYISTKTRVATITLRAIANTDAGPTLVRFGAKPNTLITSANTTDEAAENVFQGSDPATIVIAPQGTPAVTDTPPQPEPTDEPEPTSAPVPTSSQPENPSSDNIAPACTALTADTTSGVAPLSVNFTANGTDDDDTISKVTFNFGDGQVSDVTSGGALGTNSVNVQLAHTYTAAGVYQATAILTDSNSGVSDTVNCTQMITVTGGESNDNSSEPLPTAVPTIESPGAEDVLFGFGALAAFLMVTGAIIFFLF